MARYYPYAAGFGPSDKTLDLDPATDPDFFGNAIEPLPSGAGSAEPAAESYRPFAAMLADPPYSEADAAHYVPGVVNYPSPNRIAQNMIDALPVGRRAGIIHYLLPRTPANAKFVACVAVICGFNNRIRCFSVFQKVK
jgi:hypothetical protein